MFWEEEKGWFLLSCIGKKVLTLASASPSSISLILSAELRLKYLSLVIISHQMDVTATVIDTCPFQSGTTLMGAGATKMYYYISTIKLGRSQKMKT